MKHEGGYSTRVQEHLMEYSGVNYSLTSEETGLRNPTSTLCISEVRWSFTSPYFCTSASFFSFPALLPYLHLCTCRSWLPRASSFTCPWHAQVKRWMKTEILISLGTPNPQDQLNLAHFVHIGFRQRLETLKPKYGPSGNSSLMWRTSCWALRRALQVYRLCLKFTETLRGRDYDLTLYITQQVMKFARIKYFKWQKLNLNPPHLNFKIQVLHHCPLLLQNRASQISTSFSIAWRAH